MAEVSVIMGSKSDWSTMKHACEILDQFGVSYDKHVISAHRMPKEMYDFAQNAEKNGTKVIIAGAGMAAHLPGMTAANTVIPVIGVPGQTKALGGMDSLLSIVQMPTGIPVATTAIGNAGASNAALLALEILGISDEKIRQQLKDYRQKMHDEAKESSATPNCPCGQVADKQIVAEYSDVKAIEELAKESDVLTYEFENVDLQALKDVADKVKIPQGTNLLYITKHRLREKNFLRSAGCMTAPYLPVKNMADLKEAIKKIGYNCVLKTCEGGYDGHGQEVLQSDADLKNNAHIKEILATGDCILEGWVPFKVEASVMVARNAKGEVTVFPVSENYNADEILHISIVPARVSKEIYAKAQAIAKQIAEAIHLRGILGVELFILDNGDIYVNELAPRPHNSGHYSIEACNFDQFDIHDRAICNWPLPKIKLLSKVVMVNVLGQHVAGVRKVIPEKSNWHFHYYGKAEIRHNRKMGHVTILTDDIEKTLQEINDTHIWKTKVN